MKLDSYEFRRIRKHFKDFPDAKPRIASKLGYKSSAAIDQWFRRGSIPLVRLETIQRFIVQDLERRTRRVA